MTVLVVIAIVCVAGLMGFLCFCLLAGVDACRSDEERAKDDLEQERFIREWLNEQEKKDESAQK